MTKSRNLHQPFFFTVVCWGDSYYDHLLNYLIPSLLSPNNIPILDRTANNKFLIATTRNDIRKYEDDCRLLGLSNYLQVEFLEIPEKPSDITACQHMGLGHLMMTEQAFREKAIGVLLTPDLVVSDGTIKACREAVSEGNDVVLLAALRFAEEGVLPYLEKIRHESLGNSLVLDPRDLVRSALASLHSETATYVFDDDTYHLFPVASMWRVGDEGYLVHSLSWAPLAINYKPLEKHETEMLLTWTIDGDYIYQNFGANPNLKVIQNSDDAMLVSWTPLAEGERDLTCAKKQSTKTKLKRLAFARYHPSIDPMKRRIFEMPVRWNWCEPTTDLWDATTQKAKALIDQASAFEQVSINQALEDIRKHHKALWEQKIEALKTQHRASRHLKTFMKNKDKNMLSISDRNNFSHFLFYIKLKTYIFYYYVGIIPCFYFKTWIKIAGNLMFRFSLVMSRIKERKNDIPGIVLGLLLLKKRDWNRVKKLFQIIF